MRYPDDDQMGAYPHYYADLTDAIDQAHAIKAELSGAVPGMLRDYMLYTKAMAAEAADILYSCRPDDLATIHEQQKKIAAHVSVHLWVQQALDAGEAGLSDWKEAKRHIDEMVE